MGNIGEHVDFDFEALIGNQKDRIEAIKRKFSLSLAKRMEEARGDVATETLGPRRWNPDKQSEDQKSQSYAMATGAAKKAGFSVSAGDFKRGGQGRELIRRLQPNMATFRPGLPQILWIQSGKGRKSLSWGVVSETAGLIGDPAPNTTVRSGNFAVGYLWTPLEYMQKHEEGKYPFAAPIIERLIREGRLESDFTEDVKFIEQNERP